MFGRIFTSTTFARGWIALALILFSLAPTAVAQSVSEGKGAIVFQSRLGPLDVFTYKSPGYSDGPLVIVCHGMSRNADEYRDKAIGLAARMQAMVATPYFDAMRFPSEAYQQGGLLKSGSLQGAEQWTVATVEKLAEEVRVREDRPEMPYYLIGHSAGAQFLGRLAAFCTSDARRIVLANAGSYIFPSREMPFPYGFGELPDSLAGDAAISRYLAQPVTIYLGTADVGDANLPSGPQAMRQGATRYQRGKNLFQQAAEVARQRGWKFNWRLVEAEGVAHDAQAMFDHANAVRVFSAD